MKIRAIVIDDEPLALRQIASYVEKTPFLELVASCRSAIEASQVLAEKSVDVMFVDIDMPDLSGVDFVRSLAVRPIVVFTTAYGQYAVDGFRVDALDYLLKPISYADFLRSAEKVRAQYQLLNAASSAPIAEANDVIFVRSEYKMIPIKIDEILYVESRSEYVRIYIAGAKPIMTLGSLKSYDDRLASCGFIRTHRTYIVNAQKISMIERKHVIIEADGQTHRIAIGESYEANIKSWVEKYFFDGK